MGYTLDIDPKTFEGQAVCKSNTNAAHDGKIVTCPINPIYLEDGKVYSVVIDNSEGEYVFDYRLVYINSILDFFYEKKRLKSDRFSNNNIEVKLRNTADEFTPKEISCIEQICQLLNANYGEMDVLRDKKTGKIYAIDFAKTPAGPPNGLPKDMCITAIQKMSNAFATNILIPLIKNK